MSLPELRVLLVEDEDSNISSWNDQVSFHNADADRHGFCIETNHSKSVAEARAKLLSGRFDAIVVDLRLQTEPGVTEPNDHGNALIRHVLQSMPVGVVVYTGQRGEASDFGCPQVQILDKGDGLQPVFEWLAKQKELLLNIRSVRMAFERETARIFFNSIWPRWQSWASGIEASELSEMVSRHVAAHVHDALLYSAKDDAHFEEWYFVPPLRGRLDTGDLIELESDVWVVVTPRCDLAHDDKTATVLIAKCVDASRDWAEAAQKGKQKKTLDEFRRHKNSPKQHFLVPLRDDKGVERGPWLVQFDHLRALEAKEAFDALTGKRFASLAPQFVPSLVERFGAYFSRIGTPGLSIG